TPFTFGAVDVSENSPYRILVAIRPQRAGKLRINGFEIRYRDGLRHGAVHSGPDMTFTTS
ncbi:MAG: hypothetical protein JWO63_165, partial [Frankiales bacterium]|nr:hypothetical protein [Frankiales bacterium]